MWVMGGHNKSSHHHHHHHQLINLRPLFPRPPVVSSTAATTTTATAPSCSFSSCSGCSDLFSLNHHLGVDSEQGRRYKKELINASTRWKPTAEQLRTLEELYWRGTRTPSTDQIQHITAHLRRYGKIEGKNVFYWFQNHKARERQKRRRLQMDFLTHHHQPIIQRRGGGFQVEPTRRFDSIASTAAEQVDDERHNNFQKQHNNYSQGNATWQHLTLLPSPIISTVNIDGNRKEEEEEEEEEDSVTLQLFPMRSQVDCQQGEDDDQSRYAADDEKHRDMHFIEFLPPKN